MERRRILLAALLLLVIGGGLLAYRRLSPPRREAPPPVVFSADSSGRMSSLLRRFATLLGRGSGRAVTVGDVRRILSSSSDDPIARAFSEQYMRDPVLRKAWEKHRDGDEAQGFVQEVAGTPEFGKLMEQWQQDPDFVALAERVGDSLEEDVAQESASSDRMLLTGAPAPPALAAPAPVLAPPARVSGYASDLARFKSIFSLMEREPRERVLAQMEEGYSARESCGRAKAVEACDAAFKSCQAEADCARWLAHDDERSNGRSGGQDKKGMEVVRVDGPAGEGGPETGGGPAGDQPQRSGGSGRGSDDDDDDDDARPARNPFSGLSGLGKGGSKTQKDPPPVKSREKAPDQGKKRGPAKIGNCSAPNCFVAGTRVLTSAGGVPIETIRPGDKVLAMDLRTGEIIATEVLEISRSAAKGLRRLTFSSGLELRVTEEHPFFDPDTGRFRRVRELALGDRVGRLPPSDGALDAFPLGFGAGARRPSPAAIFEPAAAMSLETLTLIGIEELPAEGVPVHNFHVGEHQNYFAEGVLVHNRKLCD